MTDRPVDAALESDDAAAAPRGSALEVLGQFTVLGLTSFGGPVAHLGYFRERLVVRRRWISEQGYADLVALAQFLPGPASSQVGFALGLHRAGLLGGLAAFAAFTLPSAVLLVLAALGAPLLDGPLAEGLIAGLKVVAVAVVAHAVLGMARTLTPDLRRAAIAVGAGALVLLVGSGWATLAAIAAGAVLGLLLCRAGAAPVAGAVRIPISRRAGAASLGLLALLLVALPVLAALAPSVPLAVADGFFRAGALVFGGGHVVLPLLESAVVAPGWVSEQQFLAGYGAAQAVPGPLFTVAAFLGASIAPGAEGVLLAVVALVAIFLPGLLLIAGVLPFWGALQGRPAVQALVRGANAAVVGVLAAALYDPVMTSALVDAPTIALAVLCTVLLVVVRVPAWAVVIVGAGGGMLLSAF
ncbi:chromate efflux transporter [Microcella humidisoli]|uniref:Chromate efflux transporter n=1 Tax=Microcella humidisoli TaxID=2963406 RepID=A0ABY5FTZ4_9MICO|nr:chromate efflux transporter [Microcella humidisoli]UTT61442.1 chromate efflux transporter [Microcella humidisoli]